MCERINLCNGDYCKFESLKLKLYCNRSYIQGLISLECRDGGYFLYLWYNEGDFPDYLETKSYNDGYPNRLIMDNIDDI